MRIFSYKYTCALVSPMYFHTREHLPERTHDFLSYYCHIILYMITMYIIQMQCLFVHTSQKQVLNFLSRWSVAKNIIILLLETRIFDIPDNFSSSCVYEFTYIRSIHQVYNGHGIYGSFIFFFIFWINRNVNLLIAKFWKSPRGQIPRKKQT